jgi:hypothetical protein
MVFDEAMDHDAGNDEPRYGFSILFGQVIVDKEPIFGTGGFKCEKGSPPLTDESGIKHYFC